MIIAMGYMKGDHNWSKSEIYIARFFAYLSLFTFAMLMLVCADNILQLFFGWEGVGLASYLLIGFYYKTYLIGEKEYETMLDRLPQKYEKMILQNVLSNAQPEILY